jgi:sugar-specific transcriptional regulator TrmB
MDLKTDLQNLGLERNETKVYLVLLEIGEGFVSSIAKRAGVNRVNCYNILGNLEQKGLVASKSRKGYQTYSVLPPRVFFNTIEEKFATAKQILPQLETLYKSKEFRPTVNYYDQTEQIDRLINTMLEAKEELFGYTSMTKLINNFGETVIKGIQKRGNRARILVPNNEEEKTTIEDLKAKKLIPPKFEILAINPKEFKFESGVFIYGKKILSISYEKEELLCVETESSVQAKTQQAIFHLAWLGATSFIAM